MIVPSSVFFNYPQVIWTMLCNIQSRLIGTFNIINIFTESII